MSFLSDLFLKRNRQQVSAVVTSVTQTTPTSEMFHATRGLYPGNVNVAANVYVITATWTDTQSGNTYTFEKRCMSDRQPPVHEGQAVVVYVNLRHPQRYHMEVPCQ